MIPAESYLATKNFIPPKRAPMVSRPRLLARLADGVKFPLTIVSGPAGFGKTTLLSEWANSLHRAEFSVAWLSLDTDDNDPAHFLLYLIYALRSVVPNA